MDSNERRQIIMDNYEHPFNRGLKKDDSYAFSSTQSDSCIDHIDLMMKCENNIVKDILFDGEACAICTSATSILIQKLIGKNVDDAKKIINEFNKMINEEQYDEELIEELIVYNEVYLQPSRKNCALLPSKAIYRLLDKEE